MINLEARLKRKLKHEVTWSPCLLQKTKNKVGDTHSKIKSTEETLKTLYSRKVSLEKQIDTIKGEFSMSW